MDMCDDELAKKTESDDTDNSILKDKTSKTTKKSTKKTTESEKSKIIKTLIR